MVKHAYMTPEELKRSIVILYGREAGGQRRLAAAIGKNELTVSRWVNDRAPIGETEAILIRLLVKVHRASLTRANADSQFSHLD